MEQEEPTKRLRPNNALSLTLKRTFLEGFKRFGANFLITVNLRAAISLVLPFLRHLVNNPRALLSLDWLSESKIELRFWMTNN